MATSATITNVTKEINGLTVFVRFDDGREKTYTFDRDCSPASIRDRIKQELKEIDTWEITFQTIKAAINNTVLTPK